MRTPRGSAATLKLAVKSKFRFLDPTNDSLIAEPVPVDGTFVLTPPRFEPLDNERALDDGEPPTAVGKAVTEWWSACSGRAPEECPSGLVRAIEAVSATGANVDRIRRAFRGSEPYWRRNHAGRLSTAQIEVLVPMVGLATVQPRENAKYGRILREKHGVPLIHEIEDDLVLHGQSAEHFHQIRVAQAAALDPGDYSDANRKDFVDSLALEGIREELRGFVYLLTDDEEGNGYHVETDDGYTRVAVAQATMSKLFGGLPTDLSRLHWENGDGTLTIRHWTAHDIARAHTALRFDAAPFSVWPTIETSLGVSKWSKSASNEALAVIRLMTARMDIGIKVQPHKGSSTHMVVFGDMARFHVKGHQPVPWSRTDDDAFKARTVVTDLTRHGFLTAEQKTVFFGDEQVPWKNDPDRVPYCNRLFATVDTMVKCVVDDPSFEGRYPTVRSTLKGMGVPNSPTQAATCAASLAVIVAGLEREGEMGAFAAMLKRSFANAELRRLKDHSGDWTETFTSELGMVVEEAGIELDTVLGTVKHAAYLGPNMRALAILAMVAHGMNPALVGYTEAKKGNPGETVRHPSSMTLSGRGGRGGAGAAEAHRIVFNMAKSRVGIAQLEAIVRAVIDHEEPIVPLDPVTGVALLEDSLRQMWNRAPTMDGEPCPMPTRDSRSDDETDSDEIEDDVSSAWSAVSDTAKWDRAIDEFASNLRALGAKAELLGQVAAGPELLGLDPAEWDPDDDMVPRMLAMVGINPEIASDYDENLERVRKFFLTGVIEHYKKQGRS